MLSYLLDFLDAEYLSLLDSFETHLASHKSDPSVALGSGKESGNPPVSTTIVEQQTQSHSSSTPLPLKRKLLIVSEGVSVSSAPNKEWYDVFILTTTALPVSKRRKFKPEASTNFNPIHPNTQSHDDIIEDELTEANVLAFERGDTNSNLPITTLSNVSTSPEVTSMDPIREVPHSDLSEKVRQLSCNRSSDEPERVFNTQLSSQGSEGNDGSPLPNLTLPTSQEHFWLLV